MGRGNMSLEKGTLGLRLCDKKDQGAFSELKEMLACGQQPDDIVQQLYSEGEKRMKRFLRRGMT